LNLSVDSARGARRRGTFRRSLGLIPLPTCDASDSKAEFCRDRDVTDLRSPVKMVRSVQTLLISFHATILRKRLQWVSSQETVLHSDVRFKSIEVVIVA
jgi:hypothetical protein